MSAASGVESWVRISLAGDLRVSANGRRDWGKLAQVAFLDFQYRQAAYDAHNHHRDLTKRRDPGSMSGGGRECESCRCPSSVDFTMARLRCWVPRCPDEGTLSGTMGGQWYMATCRWMRDRRLLATEALRGIPAVVVFFAGKGRAYLSLSTGMALSESEAASSGTSGTCACARTS